MDLARFWLAFGLVSAFVWAGEFSDPKVCGRLLKGIADGDDHARALLDDAIKFGGTTESFEAYREQLRRIARARREAENSLPSRRQPDLNYLVRFGDSFLIGSDPKFRSHKRVRITIFESQHHVTTTYHPEFLRGPRRDIVMAAGIRWDEKGAKNFVEFLEKNPTERPIYEAMSEQLAAVGKERYDQMIREWMAFYLQNAAVHEWPAEMHADLRRIAIDLADRSTWIVVREKNADGSQGEIVTTLRLIESEHGLFHVTKKGQLKVVACHLPACFRGELRDPELLPLQIVGGPGIVIPRTAKTTHTENKDGDSWSFGEGIVFEPGSWAVSAKARKTGIAASFLHAVRLGLGRSRTRFHDPEGVSFITWADPLSRPVFERIGFKNVLDEIGKPVTFERYGVKWQVMRLTIADLQQAARNLNRIRRDFTDEEAAEMKLLLEEVTDRSGDRRYLDIDLE